MTTFYEQVKSGWQPRPDWIYIPAVDSEVNLLYTDEGYPLVQFNATMVGGYTVEIYGGADGTTLLSSTNMATNTVFSTLLTVGAGKPCNQSYTTFRVRVFRQDTANPFLGFGFRNAESLSNFVVANTSCRILKTGNMPGFNAFAGGSFANQGIEYIEMGNYDVLTSLAVLATASIRLRKYKGGNFPAVTIIDRVLQNCSILEEIEIGDLSAVTNAPQPFAIASIKKITLGNIIGSTNMANFFNGCLSLEEVTMGNITGGTTGSMSEFFQACRSLKSFTIGTISGSNSVAFQSSQLFSLKEFEIPSLKVTRLALTGISSTQRSPIEYVEINWAGSDYSGISPQIDLRSNNLSATELDRIFTALPTVTAKTINVAGNVGSSTCDTTIATAKGWTVTIV